MRIRRLKAEASWLAARRARLLECDAEDAKRWSATHGARMCTVACHDVRWSAAPIIERCKDVLEFPDWAGDNWDAFNDLIHDLSWFKDERLVVLFQDVAKSSRAGRMIRSICTSPLDFFYFPKPKIVFLIHYADVSRPGPRQDA